MYTNDQGKSGIPLLFKAILLLAGPLIGFIIIRIFFTPFTISDDSMNPNFQRGDIVLILKSGQYGIGDAILFQSPLEQDRVLLKRIIAAEGSTVEIKNKIIFIDEKKAEFKWKTQNIDARSFPMYFTRRDNLPAVKLRRKEYFVIGDNLDYSFDSRSFGPVKEDAVIGRVIYIW